MTGGWLTFDSCADTTTTEATAPFVVFERACPELSRRVRIPRAGVVGIRV